MVSIRYTRNFKGVSLLFSFFKCKETHLHQYFVVAITPHETLLGESQLLKIKQNLLKPVATRVGTFLAGVLAAGMYLSPEQVANLENAITVIVLVLVDLVSRKTGILA